MIHDKMPCILNNLFKALKKNQKNQKKQPTAATFAHQGLSQLKHTHQSVMENHFQFLLNPSIMS